jgi:macrolide transport system ATP-binding/permease protein
VASINPVLAGYRPEQLPALYRQLEDRLSGIVGITSVSLSLYSPMRGDNWSSGISIEGRSNDPSREDSASWNRVGPRYFETLGTRLVRGRSIGEQDTPASPRVTVVNQAFVRKFFPDGDPLGKHLGIGDASHSNDFEIVGVVEDTKYVRANEPAWPTFFLPLLQTVAQRDASDGSAQTRSTYVRDIELRMSGRSDHLEASVRQTLAEIDPDLTLLGLVTLDEQLGRNFNQQRLMARLTMLYAILALILACVGLYGVAAYTVTRRTGEIGIRMALGADRGRVIRWVLAGTLRQIACGLLIGIPLALATGRALSSQLYDVSPRDPVILNAAALALVVSAGLAALIPARRAASIEPVRALRAD